MKLRKILTVALYSALVLCGTTSFAGCKNSKESGESSETLVTSQNSEKGEENTNDSTSDEISKQEESGKQDSSAPSSKEFTEEELNAVKEVDSAIEKMKNSVEYKNGDYSERKKIAEDLMKELKNKGLITESTVDEDNGVLSFSYKDDCSSGKIQLNDEVGSDTSREESENIQQSSTQTENSSSESENNTNKTIITSDFELPESERKLICKKTLEDFENTAVKSGDNARGLFKNYFTGKTNLSETHCRIYAYGSMISTDSFSTSYIDFQKSDNKAYMKNAIKISGTDGYNADEDYIFKDGKIYALYTKEKMYTVYEGDSESQIQTVTGLGEAVGKIEESGTCELDGKDMYYEFLVDDQGTKTVAYFDDDKFYKAEVYRDISESSGDQFVLLGYLYASFDLDIDDSLYDIPSGYKNANSYTNDGSD